MKRGRGRPKTKPHFFGPGRVTVSYGFKPLPAGEISSEFRTLLAGWIRERAERPFPVGIPMLRRPQHAARRAPLPSRPITPALAAWLQAAADALVAGDGVRASYYLFHALRAREVEILDQLYELAEIGQAKIDSDKRKGHRGNFREIPKKNT